MMAKGMPHVHGKALCHTRPYSDDLSPIPRAREARDSLLNVRKCVGLGGPSPSLTFLARRFTQFDFYGIVLSNATNEHYLHGTSKASRLTDRWVGRNKISDAGPVAAKVGGEEGRGNQRRLKWALRRAGTPHIGTGSTAMHGRKEVGMAVTG
uniref:Uncharacterized protein n=1 Tax=Oryza punctata TaxID=4537 RepID=A0A0E0M109_ORYPU